MQNIEDLGEPLTGRLLDPLSRFTGESPEDTQRTFRRALPLSMYAIADYGSSEAGAQSLLDGYRSGTAPELSVDDLGTVLTDPVATRQLSTRGSSFLDQILGDRREGLVAALAEGTAANPTAVWKVLSIATPLALRVIGNRVRSGNFDAAGLSTFLSGQKAALAQNLPGGVSSGGGERISPGVTVRAPEAALPREVAPSAPRRQAKIALWPWALGAAAVLLVLMALFGRGGERTPRVQGRTAPVTAPRTTPSDRAPPAAEPRSLRDDLDRYFTSESGSQRFELRGYAADQPAPADELAAALASHPDARVRLEAFGTDEVDARERAEEVKDRLVSRGVDPERVETAGRLLPDPAAPPRIDALIMR
jgi:hypothetical protein